tara:strand:+ start:14206 stop:14742 length:537 start_codon:yes stop_codon:yes gene_type:complete
MKGVEYRMDNPNTMCDEVETKTAPDSQNKFAELTEATILAADERTRSGQKRIRRADLAARHGRRRVIADGVFHDEEEALQAAIQAVVALCGESSRPPDWFNTNCSPASIYKWFVNRIIEYGEECRKEGIHFQADSEAPRVPPEHAMEALQLMNTLRTMLSGTSQTTRPLSPSISHGTN